MKIRNEPQKVAILKTCSVDGNFLRFISNIRRFDINESHLSSLDSTLRLYFILLEKKVLARVAQVCLNRLKLLI